jgi:hypothetical protein
VTVAPSQPAATATNVIASVSSIVPPQGLTHSTESPLDPIREIESNTREVLRNIDPSVVKEEYIQAFIAEGWTSKNALATASREQLHEVMSRVKMVQSHQQVILDHFALFWELNSIDPYLGQYSKEFRNQGIDLTSHLASLTSDELEKLMQDSNVKPFHKLRFRKWWAHAKLL